MGKPSGPSAWDRRSERAKAYRGWYNLPLWRDIRSAQLAKQPLCERCLARGTLTPATVCNHKTPHKGDWTKFTAGPFESTCKPCHDGIIQAEERLGYSKEIGPDGWPVDVENHPFYKRSR